MVTQAEEKKDLKIVYIGERQQFVLGGVAISLEWQGREQGYKSGVYWAVSVSDLCFDTILPQ